MKKLFSSRKSMETYEIMIYIVIPLAVVLILLVLIAPRLLKTGKSSGCEGIFTKGTLDEKFQCFKGQSCPEGTKSAQQSGWSFFSGGCPSGQVCCVGKMPEGVGDTAFKGSLDVKMGDKSVAGETITVKKGEDTGFSVQGTDNIKYCKVDLVVPLKDKKTKTIPIKDQNTQCTNVVSFNINAGNEDNADIGGEYKLEIVGYTSDKKSADSVVITIKVEAEAQANGQVVFDMYYYDDKSEKKNLAIKSMEVLKIDQPIGLDTVYYDLQCEGCILLIDKIKQTESTQSVSYSNKDVILNKGINKFEIEGSDGSPINTYYIEYTKSWADAP